MTTRDKVKDTPQNGYAYSEAEEVALMSWLDFALDLTSNGSKRLNPLLVRYGGLKKGIITKALADGIILSMVLTGLCPDKVNFKKQNFNQRPKVKTKNKRDNVILESFSGYDKQSRHFI